MTIKAYHVIKKLGLDGAKHVETFATEDILFGQKSTVGDLGAVKQFFPVSHGGHRADQAHEGQGEVAKTHP